MSTDTPLDLLSALDLLPDPTVVVGADGSIVHCTPMAARLLGRPSDHLVGESATDVIPLVDSAGLDWWDCTRPLLPDARLLPRIAETDVMLTAADGRSRPVVLTGARHADADGQLRWLVLSLRRGERRRRLDAARSDLVSTVSHELRSPLTSVKGFTKTLLAKWDRFSDEQKKQMLATVNEDADRVTRLLGELLDVSRIDAGRLQLRRQMVDVPAIVDKVVQRIRTTIDEGGRVTCDSTELPRLYADPDKLEQVLTNLIENGLKYGAGKVTIAAEETDGLVELRVSDEGAGIEQAHLSHIFTKFFRRPGERRTGTGLGLYISKGIVEAHGGRMWAESPEDAGAIFRFTLPKGGLELAGVPLDAVARPVADGRAATP
jgi:signal transduction histidine kinase